MNNIPPRPSPATGFALQGEGDFEQALRFAAIFSLNFVLYAEIYGCGLSSGACQLPLRPGRLRQVSFCSSRILALVRKSRTSASGR